MSDRTHSFIVELATSFRRIRGSNREGDLTTIWHQGRAGAEMITWKTEEGAIVQQELSFYGQVILFKLGRQLQTAAVPAEVETTHSGMSKADMVEPEAEASQRTLANAVALLEAVEPRDEYYEHLLEQVRLKIR